MKQQKKFTVVSVHNRYLNRGGEDEVFEAEAELLRQNGCAVVPVVAQAHNPVGITERFRMAADAVWSRKWFAEFGRILESVAPDVVHVHNFFPSFSPSIYYACRKYNVALVQTLHNYRLKCPKSTFFRENKVCEDCLGRTVTWPGILHSCYQDSRAATTVVTGMLALHNVLHTWTDLVDVYVSLTVFSKGKFVEGGIPGDKIVVKPNFISSFAVPPDFQPPLQGKYCLFVGRLSEEKGIRVLIDAYQKGRIPVPLIIAGSGPLESELRNQTAANPNILWVGRQPRQSVLGLMSHASALVFPSMWFEGFPVTIVEAFASGLPVIASNLGSMAELIEDGRTGLHFVPGDPNDLAAKIVWSQTMSGRMESMSKYARNEYEQKYTAERNFEMLMEIYRLAIDRRQTAVPHVASRNTGS